jgi:integrase
MCVVVPCSGESRLERQRPITSSSSRKSSRSRSELGAPVHPEWYFDEFGRILRAAKLRRITLHDSRHTTLSLMEKAGVPISVISKWAGHYDSAFTQKTYVHAGDEDLAQGAEKLVKIYKIA